MSGRCDRISLHQGRGRVAAPTLLALVLFAGSAAFAQEAPESEEGKTLYFLGVMQGRTLQQDFQFTPEELENVISGLRDGVLGRAKDLDERAYGTRLQTLATERRAVALDKEKAASVAFVSAASATEGAKTTESGLVITTLTDGSGASPAATDTVKVHYHGTLRDGRVFDSSVERGQPAEFPLNRVIPCWTEGLQLMKVGGKARLVCPPDIAYGDRGAPPRLPGGAVLSFEVELLEIVQP